MATSDPKMDEITTASQELAAQQSQDLEMEDSDQDSSSEFSTTEDSAVDSPIAKRIALARVVTNAGSQERSKETSGTQKITQEPIKEELGAFVVQLDFSHWEHELQVLSAMSTNRQLKVTANGTLNGKRIIKPQDSSTQLWLQSCTSLSGKPVKFTQLIKKSTMTAVLQNVHQFISMEALLTDERISTAERIMSYNLGTKTPEPTRSVKVSLNMKTVPTEIRINFLGKFAVRPYVTKPVRCYRCQRFGHIAAACLARTERCSMCSGLHRTQQCLTKVQNSVTVTLKCANCGEEHSANSNRCSVLREKMQIKMNNATQKSRPAVSKPPPPLVTSGEFPTIPTSDNRKKILTESLLKTGKSFAAISHVPRSVALAARSSMRKTTNMTAFELACVNQGSNSEQHAVNQDSKIISEQQSLKQSSNNKQTEQQSLKQDNRKRSAEQSLKSKEQIVKEVVPTTIHSQSTADTAGTFDRIFTVLMAQMEQLRPLLTVENPGAKKIVCKMITSIKELLDDLMELQTQ